MTGDLQRSGVGCLSGPGPDEFREHSKVSLIGRPYDAGFPVILLEVAPIYRSCYQEECGPLSPITVFDHTDHSHQIGFYKECSI